MIRLEEGFNTNLSVGLRGGWRTNSDGLQTSATLGLNRTEERRRSRMMYFQNALLGGAADISNALLVGDQLTYGEVHDPTVKIALEEFFLANNLGNLIPERWMIEFMTDGEQLTIFPKDEVGRDAPAIIAFVDVDGPFELEASTTRGANPSDMVTQITIETNGVKTTWYQGEFIWTASQAHYNDPRGWPLMARACDAAQAYYQLINHRLNTHELQARILGIYKAFIDTSSPEAGEESLSEKSAYFTHLPRRGGVMVVGMDSETGHSEEIEFFRAGQGASDAETDARALLRLVGMTLGGLPEHWLGEGGNANRATAGEMSTPALAVGRRRQNILRGYLDRLMRAELIRRFGPERLYKIRDSAEVFQAKDINGDPATPKRKPKTKKVRAQDLYFPWNLPDLNEYSLRESLERATLAAQLNLASPQTLAASMGFDPVEEQERLAAVGLQFGVPRVSAADKAATDTANKPNPDKKNSDTVAERPLGEKPAVTKKR